MANTKKTTKREPKAVRIAVLQLDASHAVKQVKDERMLGLIIKFAALSTEQAANVMTLAPSLTGKLG